jgi:hypothetical protein
MASATRWAIPKCVARSCRLEGSSTAKMTMTESVSPYTTLDPGTRDSASALVFSIIARPVAVTAAAMGTHGRNPLEAPRKP